MKIITKDEYILLMNELFEKLSSGEITEAEFETETSKWTPKKQDDGKISYSYIESVHDARINAGLTLKEAAEKTGINIKTIESWEYGSKKANSPTRWAEKKAIEELKNMAKPKPFLKINGSMLMGVPLPNGFEYAAENAVETPAGKIGALLRNKKTGIYVIMCAGAMSSCPQDWAAGVSEI